MTLTKDALIEMIRDKVGYPVKEAKEILEMILEEVKAKLEVGKEVKISGFGKWRERRYFYTGLVPLSAFCRFVLLMVSASSLLLPVDRVH